MNDRILGALQAAGIKDAPLASLDHEQQFFALTPHALFYQSGAAASPLQQVTLREISRIHSDHQGTLRVETGNQTSITASLLGFDPHRVQRFFQTVRDTTARAKQQPTSPLPSVGSKMFGSAPAAGAPATPTRSADPSTSGAGPAEQAATPPQDQGPIILGKAPDSPATAPEKARDEPASTPKVVKIGGSSAAQPGEVTQSAPPKTSPGTSRIGATTPVAVSAGSTGSFNKPEPATSTTKTAAVTEKSPPTSPTPDKATAPDLAPAVPTDSPAAPHTDTGSRLARSAQTVGGLRFTVRVLALVLVLGALGMGYVLWQQGKSSQIPALWTVTMGVVTAVALLVLAEVLKLLSALGQAVSQTADRTRE
ncbi:hypothetical protein DKM44_04745 [Deinococcus irradiatisoli]|uniref:Uncharacterized protein n=1 Tax=Deinococcus irradiatisoli TaxID=2202254 RepID=A0A2Z3JN36_9DEIO|nr:hypothetical protein [Deinococcus irradiatisoli]AWN22624.1 hypothetical protein DKM44_04745 [Deinococcus irradiatisoli]